MLYFVTRTDTLSQEFLTAAATPPTPDRFDSVAEKWGKAAFSSGPPARARADYPSLPPPKLPKGYLLESSVRVTPDDAGHQASLPLDREATNPERNPHRWAPGYLPPLLQAERERTNPEHNPWFIVTGEGSW